MSPKMKKKAPAKSTKAEKASKPAKSEAKSKKELKAAPAPVAPDAAAVDPDELEEQQDAAASSASAAGGNAAALAAASSTTEMSASFKNFRHHPDMENFYRFIFDNDLRHEALAIMNEMMLEKQNRKLIKATKAQAH